MSLLTIFHHSDAPNLLGNKQGLSEQAIEIASTMHGANDLNIIANDAIEEEIGSRDEIAQTGPYVVSSRPHLGVLDEVGCSFIQPVEYAVRSGGIIRRNMRPDIDQIFAGSLREEDTRHMIVMKDCDGCELHS